MSAMGSHLVLLLLLGSCLPWTSANIFNILGIKNNMQLQLMSTFVMTQMDNQMENALKAIPSKTCATHLREYIHGMKKFNFWALKMFDSSTKIPQSMLGGVDVNFGNYDECVTIRDISSGQGKFSGKHCLVRVCSSERPNCADMSREAASLEAEVEKKIILAGGIANVKNVKDDLAALQNVSMVHVSVCVPSTCSSQDLEVFFNKAVRQVTGLVRINVEDEQCHTLEEPPLSAGGKLTLTFLLFVFVVVVGCTVYDVMTEEHGERKELYIIFSAHSNFKRIMETNSDGDTLQCLHGVRAISIIWVILGQRYLSDARMPLINRFDIIEFAGSWSNIIILLTPMMADSFLLLSGLQLSYGFLNRSIGQGSFDFKSFYLHRYVRLTPVLAVTLLLQSTVLNNVSSGPVWEMMHPKDCGSSWWHSLLYIKNYLMPDTKTTCSEESWYLGVDMQLYLLSPLLLIPLWKNQRRGRQILAVALGLSWFIPFVQSLSQEIVMPCRYLAPPTELKKSMDNMYYATHSRAAPWIIGLLLGYVLHRLRLGQGKVLMSKGTAAGLWAIAFVLFLMVAFSTHSCLRLERDFSNFQSAFSNASSHMLWGLALAIVIFACVTGYGGPANQLLTMEIWQPISRLSYCMYLVHLPLQLYDTSITKTLGYFAHSTAITEYMADVPISLAIATLLSLMFEWPAILMEKYFNKDKIDYALVNKVLVADMEKYRDVNGKEKNIM